MPLVVPLNHHVNPIKVTRSPSSPHVKPLRIDPSAGGVPAPRLRVGAAADGQKCRRGQGFEDGESQEAAWDTIDVGDEDHRCGG